MAHEHEHMHKDNQELFETLNFARQLAKEEIDSIERIHKRTLQSFAYIGVFVAAAAALFGYIGYVNLKTAAISTAENQMRTEVKKQVQAKLTKENIDDIVQDQVRSFSATRMSTAIHDELINPPLSTVIRAAAADEARNQIKQQFLPRHFTETQSRDFVTAVNEQSELYEYPVVVLPMNMNIEAEVYANEIRASVARTKMKLVDFGGFAKNPVEGVAIYRDQSSSKTYAIRLQEAFLACGIHAIIVDALPVVPQSSKEKPPMVIFVGPKHM